MDDFLIENDALDEKLKEQIERLEKKRKWYQSIKIGDIRTISDSDFRASIRTDSVLKFIPQILEPNDRVLDIGCNAGLHSITAAQYCNEVVGVDVSKEFIEQAEFLKSVWKINNEIVTNVSFKIGDVLEDLESISNFSVIFALKVLYHSGFVKGIHEFMSTIERSEVRAILAQGHVTQPRYSTINSMKELFEEYGFTTVVLENIPEYPIVLAIRKGDKISEKVSPVIGVSRNIEYYDDYSYEDNIRCKACMSKIDEERLDFQMYKEIFERCVIEVGIMKGTMGTVRPVQLTQGSEDETKFALKMGVNKHSKARVKSASEFFDLLEKYGEREFLKKKMYRQTKYWLTSTADKGMSLSKIINIFISDYEDKKRIMPLLQMYKNMHIIRDLVPNAREKRIKYNVYHPEDFPWSINYFGYVKRRDGSHRRMIMKYFGVKTVDEIVVDFEKITQDDLQESIPYVKDNFEWFYNEVLEASKEL